MSDVSKYSFSCFSTQLRKIRKAFGFTQAQAGVFIGVNKILWSAWESSRRIPDLEKFIALAKMFSVDISYFVIPDADPLDYSLCKAPMKEIIPSTFLTVMTLHSFPFTETNIARFVFKKLNDMLYTRNLVCFHVFPHSGITTILEEFVNRESKALLISNYQGYQDIIRQVSLKLNSFTRGQIALLLFDKAEQLSVAAITELCRQYSDYYSIALFSINGNLLDYLTSFAFKMVKVDDFSVPDFTAICKALFPKANPEALTMLRLISELELPALVSFRMQSEGDKIVNKEDVLENYRKIYKE